jgi:hypothetical protein
MEMVEENVMVASREREWTEAEEGATAEPRHNIKVIYYNVPFPVSCMIVM